MKSKKKITVYDMKQNVALFEGRRIDDNEAKRMLTATTKRNNMLKKTFGLSDKQVNTVCGYTDEISSILIAFCDRKEEEVKERVRGIEQRAMNQMHNIRRGRQLRTLLTPR